MKTELSNSQGGDSSVKEEWFEEFYEGLDAEAFLDDAASKLADPEPTASEAQQLSATVKCG